MNILKNFILYIREVKKEDIVNKIVELGQHVSEISLNNNLEAFFRSNLDLLLELLFVQKDQDKIFKLFQRLAADNKTVGTEIELALCKKIIERHNGTIKVESQPRTGITFFINLPLKQQTGNIN